MYQLIGICSVPDGSFNNIGSILNDEITFTNKINAPNESKISNFTFTDSMITTDTSTISFNNNIVQDIQDLFINGVTTLHSDLNMHQGNLHIHQGNLDIFGNINLLTNNKYFDKHIKFEDVS